MGEGFVIYRDKCSPSCERIGVECETQESFGLLQSEVIIVMTRDELMQMRLAVSLAAVEFPKQQIFQDFLGATD